MLLGGGAIFLVVGFGLLSSAAVAVVILPGIVFPDNTVLLGRVSAGGRLAVGFSGSAVIVIGSGSGGFAIAAAVFRGGRFTVFAGCGVASGSGGGGDDDIHVGRRPASRRSNFRLIVGHGDGVRIGAGGTVQVHLIGGEHLGGRVAVGQLLHHFGVHLGGH